MKTSAFKQAALMSLLGGMFGGGLPVSMTESEKRHNEALPCLYCGKLRKDGCGMFCSEDHRTKYRDIANTGMITEQLKKDKVACKAMRKADYLARQKEDREKKARDE